MSHDTGQRIRHLVLTAVKKIITEKSNIKDIAMVMMLSFLLNGVWTYMDSHLTTNNFEIDGLPNFLRYGALFTHLRCAGAQL